MDIYNTLWCATIMFFTIFGIIQLAKYIINYFNDNKCGNFSIVITVKNQEGNLENIIRSIVWRSLNSLDFNTVPNILIVDLGSQDSTPKIASILEKQYGFIKYINNPDYIKLFQNT